MSAVKPVPEEHALSPYLVVKGAAKAIEFYAKAFGAREVFRLVEPSGKVGHAELEIGKSTLMLADEYPDFGALSPVTLGGSPVALHLYVEDVDAVVLRATAAGATVLRPVKDEFFGDRTAMVADPFGHKWHLSTRKENVSPEEMQRRMDAAYA
jgi:PhnB protein